MQSMRSRSTPSELDRRTEHGGLGEDLRRLSDEELDHRIRVGLEVWSDIQEQLLATGGMPPSRELVAQVVGYLEGSYRDAEEAQVEAVRRQCHRVRHRSADRTLCDWSLA